MPATALRPVNFRIFPKSPEGLLFEPDIDSRLPANTERKQRIMPKWEYITTPLLIHNTTAILNNWGQDGWELVQVTTGPEGGLVAFLKRPIQG